MRVDRKHAFAKWRRDTPAAFTEAPSLQDAEFFSWSNPITRGQIAKTLLQSFDAMLAGYESKVQAEGVAMEVPAPVPWQHINLCFAFRDHGHVSDSVR